MYALPSQYASFVIAFSNPSTKDQKVVKLPNGTLVASIRRSQSDRNSVLFELDGVTHLVDIHDVRTTKGRRVEQRHLDKSSSADDWAAEQEMWQSLQSINSDIG